MRVPFFSMSYNVFVAVVAAIVIAVPTAVRSQSPPPPGLKGISTVRLLLEISDEAREVGVSEYLLRARVESDLRDAGLRIDSLRYDAVVFVNAESWKAGMLGGAFAVRAQIEVFRAVSLIADTTTQLMASVWRSDGSAGWTGENNLRGTLEQAVQRQSSEFIDNWARASGR